MSSEDMTTSSSTTKNKSKKRRPHGPQPSSVVFAALLTLLTVVPGTLADILTFGNGALPNCAYQCVPLWSAQYACPDESTAGKCFCLSTYVDPLLNGDGGALCPDACPPGNGAEEVKAWFDGACANFLGGQPQQSTTAGSATATKTGTAGTATGTATRTASGTGTSTQFSKPTNTPGPKPIEIQDNSNKAVEWWKSNWYWFLLAFLLITIPLTLYALFFPFRKWARGQIIKRRARRPLPPINPAMFGPSNPQSYAEGGLSSPGYVVPPLPETGVRQGFEDDEWGNPHIPPITRAGSGQEYFPTPKARDSDVEMAMPVTRKPVGSGVRNGPKVMSPYNDNGSWVMPLAPPGEGGGWVAPQGEFNATGWSTPNGEFCTVPVVAAGPLPTHLRSPSGQLSSTSASGSTYGPRPGSGVSAVGKMHGVVVMDVPPPMPAIRQHSWERKLREQFEGKKTLGEKLAFWKKSGDGGGAQDDEEEKGTRGLGQRSRYGAM